VHLASQLRDNAAARRSWTTTCTDEMRSIATALCEDGAHTGDRIGAGPQGEAWTLTHACLRDAASG